MPNSGDARIHNPLDAVSHGGAAFELVASQLDLAMKRPALRMATEERVASRRDH